MSTAVTGDQVYESRRRFPSYFDQIDRRDDLTAAE